MSQVYCKGYISFQRATSAFWKQSLWERGREQGQGWGFSAPCHCAVSPNCSWHLVSSSKQSSKQVKLSLTYLRTALKIVAGLNRVLSPHASPGDTASYVHGFFPPECTEERRFFSSPKISEIVIWSGESGHVEPDWGIQVSFLSMFPFLFPFPLPNTHLKTLPLPHGFMYTLPLTLWNEGWIKS